MKYQVGDLIKWDDVSADFEDEINFNDRKKERYMVITRCDKIPSMEYRGIYTYRYIDTGREDCYTNTLLEANTSKVG